MMSESKEKTKPGGLRSKEQVRGQLKDLGEAEGNMAPQSPAPPRLSLEDLPKRDGLSCTLDDLVATSWEEYWNPDD